MAQAIAISQRIAGRLEGEIKNLNGSEIHEREDIRIYADKVFEARFCG